MDIFNKDDKEFYLKFNANKSIEAPTEIFVPYFHFRKGFEVKHSAGELLFDKKTVCCFYPEADGEQRILVIGK